MTERNIDVDIARMIDDGCPNCQDPVECDRTGRIDPACNEDLSVIQLPPPRARRRVRVIRQPLQQKRLPQPARKTRVRKK